MKEKILSILRDVLENRELDWNCSQSNCEAWDSMNQLNLASDIETEFGISLEPEEIAEMKDCESIYQIVSSKLK